MKICEENGTQRNNNNKLYEQNMKMYVVPMKLES